MLPPEEASEVPFPAPLCLKDCRLLVGWRVEGFTNCAGRWSHFAWPRTACHSACNIGSDAILMTLYHAEN
jgi:hypothetical protein